MSGRPIPPNRRWQQANRSRRTPPPDPAHREMLEELLRRMVREDPRFQTLLEEHLRQVIAIYQVELGERRCQELPRPPRRMSLIQRILSLIQRILFGLFQIALILTLSWGIGTLIERFFPQGEPTQVEQDLDQVLMRRASEALERFDKAFQTSESSPDTHASLGED